MVLPDLRSSMSACAEVSLLDTSQADSLSLLYPSTFPTPYRPLVPAPDMHYNKSDRLQEKPVQDIELRNLSYPAHMLMTHAGIYCKILK